MLVTILVSMAITALVVLLAFPQTPAGKTLHRILVEAPARFLLDFTWEKLGKTLLLGVALVLLVLMGPEMMLLLAASGLDAAALIEVMMILSLAAVSSGIRSAWRNIRRIAAKPAQRVRAIPTPRNRRQRAKKIRRRLKNDDQGEPGWAFA